MRQSARYNNRYENIIIYTLVRDCAIMADTARLIRLTTASKKVFVRTGATILRLTRWMRLACAHNNLISFVINLEKRLRLSLQVPLTANTTLSARVAIRFHRSIR